MQGFPRKLQLTGAALATILRTGARLAQELQTMFSALAVINAQGCLLYLSSDTVTFHILI